MSSWRRQSTSFRCGPSLAGSQPIRLAGRARHFHHFDLYAQALAKVERGHQQDLEDVREMLRRGLVDTAAAWMSCEIASQLYRYPAVDPKSFRRAMGTLFGPTSTP